MSKVVVISFIVLWFVNSIALNKVYDTSTCDGYIDFWTSRSWVYDLMFCMLAVSSFLSSKGLTKAVSCFAVVVTAGSFIDKGLFKITGYLYGDIVLILLGIIVSVIVWKKSASGKISGT